MNQKNVVTTSAQEREPIELKSEYYIMDRIQDHLDYWLAQKAAVEMLARGLINEEEFEILSGINLETFRPLFWEIYPESSCYVGQSE